LDPYAYQSIPVTCPNCRYRFVAPILMLIDAGRNPEAKALFLSGQANLAACPQCGHAGMLGTPLVYHDADKELLFTFSPPELGGSEREQERVLGDLTNRLMSTLLPEQRKGYLLRPRRFYTLESMVEAILEADGITREMLEAQRARSMLLDRLLSAQDEPTRRAIAQGSDPQIDYQFFELLSMNLELAEAGGQPGVAELLLDLREQLLEWTTQGREIAAREEAVLSLGDQVTREKLLDELVKAALGGEQVKVETLVAYARPAIDYVFYQQLTSRVESAGRAGRTDEAQTLKQLRDTVLDLTSEIDERVRQATEDADRFLQQLLASTDPEPLLRANPRRVDGLFLDVLTTKLQAASQAGQAGVVERLSAIRELVLKLIQESQPPELQFVNQLLTAEFPDGTRALLEGNRPLLDEGLLEVMALLAEDLERRGHTQVAQRLAQIRTQAVAMIG
jgi:hypothetical protein